MYCLPKAITNVKILNSIPVPILAMLFIRCDIKVGRENITYSILYVRYWFYSKSLRGVAIEETATMMHLGGVASATKAMFTQDFKIAPLAHHHIESHKENIFFCKSIPAI